MKIVKRNSSEILLLLVLSDFAIIALHLATSLSSISNDRYWSIDHDRGFGETFQYIKELWLVLSFAALIKIRSDWSYLSLCLLFSYLLVDDLFSIHEHLGTAIAARFNFQPLLGLQPSDLGELPVHLIAGLVLLVVIGYSYWFGSKSFCHVCQRVMLLFAALAFSGIALDVLHGMVGKTGVLALPLEILEDGGEMVVMSALCWYGVSLLQRRDSIQIAPIVLPSKSLLKR